MTRDEIKAKYSPEVFRAAEQIVAIKRQEERKEINEDLLMECCEELDKVEDIVTPT